MDSQAKEAVSISLPSAKPIPLSGHSTLQLPLSRRGIGPGLFVLVPKQYGTLGDGVKKKTLDPEPLQKWAEEGFAVVEIRIGSEDSLEVVRSAFEIGVEALMMQAECVFLPAIGAIGMSWAIFVHLGNCTIFYLSTGRLLAASPLYSLQDTAHYL